MRHHGDRAGAARARPEDRERHPGTAAPDARTVGDDAPCRDRDHYGVAGRSVLALVNPERLRRILTKMLDENEFLSPYGIRALSKFHEDHPYVFRVGGQEHRVDYLPAESDSGMFGGNSNWRGPIWMPVNVMLIRALLNFYVYYGDTFKIECPTGSGKMMNLFEVAKEISDRLTRIFLRDGSGRRPVYGGTEKFQTDPHWRDLILFYEYFHGDNGAGLGASHQTGWTGAGGEADPAVRTARCGEAARGRQGCRLRGWNVQECRRAVRLAAARTDMHVRSVPRSIRSTHACG